MQTLLELLPLAAFVIAYKFFGGIYPATATLMVGMVLALAVLWIRLGRLPRMFAVSTVLVLVFGALTLWLRNAHFIQWKPSILLWLVAVAFLASAFIGRRPLAQMMLEPALAEVARVEHADALRLERADWLKLNAAWVVYGLTVGAINLVLVYTVSEDVWVDTKIPLIMGSMVLFLTAQMVWLYRRGKLKT
jgi:intracellular septation protein